MERAGKPSLATKIQVNIFDGCAVSTDNGDPLELRSRKALAILAYLSLKIDPVEERERLVGLLWSESPEQQARASLRQCIKSLRTAMATHHFSNLVSDRNRFGLVRGKLNCDVQQALDSLREGVVQDCLLDERTNPERILYGLDDLDPPFFSWLMVQRQTLKQTLVRLLEEILGSKSAQAVRAAQVLTRIDASHEPAHRCLIADHAACGRTAAALEQYADLWKILDTEYDSEPARETSDLIAKIKMGEFSPEGSLRGQEIEGIDNPASRPVITISPLNASGPDVSYVIQGFWRELTASLVRFREWIVVDIAADSNNEQHVDNAYSLEAESIADEDGIVIILRHCKTGQCIWSETAKIESSKLRNSLSRIVRRTSLALNIYLSEQRLRELTLGDHTFSEEAYDLWLLGLSHAFQWQPEGHLAASEAFHKAINRSENFAPAHASLVMLENTRHLAFPGIFADHARLELELARAKFALAIDPLDTRTHLAAAWSHSMTGQFASAARYFRQSYELNENDPWTIVSAALGLAFCDEMSEARRLAQEAAQLAIRPTASHCEYQANIAFLSADYQACVDWGHQASELTSDSLGWRVASLSLLGRLDEARRESNRFLETARSRWQGDCDPTIENIVGWFLQCHPISSREAKQRLQTGLVKAGLQATEQSVDHMHLAIV